MVIGLLVAAYSISGCETTGYKGKQVSGDVSTPATVTQGDNSVSYVTNLVEGHGWDLARGGGELGGLLFLLGTLRSRRRHAEALRHTAFAIELSERHRGRYESVKPTVMRRATIGGVNDLVHKAAKKAEVRLGKTSTA